MTKLTDNIKTKVDTIQARYNEISNAPTEDREYTLYAKHSVLLSDIGVLLSFVHALVHENDALHYGIEMTNTRYDPVKARKVLDNMLQGKNPNTGSDF